MLLILGHLQCCINRKKFLGCLNHYVWASLCENSLSRTQVNILLGAGWLSMLLVWRETRSWVADTGRQCHDTQVEGRGGLNATHLFCWHLCALYKPRILSRWRPSSSCVWNALPRPIQRFVLLTSILWLQIHSCSSGKSAGTPASICAPLRLPPLYCMDITVCSGDYRIPEGRCQACLMYLCTSSPVPATNRNIVTIC